MVVHKTGKVLTPLEPAGQRERHSTDSITVIASVRIEGTRHQGGSLVQDAPLLHISQLPHLLNSSRNETSTICKYMPIASFVSVQGLSLRTGTISGPHKHRRGPKETTARGLKSCPLQVSEAKQTQNDHIKSRISTFGSLVQKGQTPQPMG